MTPKEILNYGIKAEAKRLGLDLREEFEFHDARKWRFDYALPSLMIAIEYDGHHESGATARRRAGLKPLTKSGHSTLKGLSRDHEKTNTAQCMGWIVLRFTAMHFNEKSRKAENLRGAFATLTAAINARKASSQSGDRPGSGMLDLHGGS